MNFFIRTPTWPKYKTHKKFVRTTFIYESRQDFSTWFGGSAGPFFQERNLNLLEMIPFFSKTSIFCDLFWTALFLKKQPYKGFSVFFEKTGREKSPVLKRKKVPFLIRFLQKRYLFTNFLLKTVILRTFFPCKNYVAFG